MRALAPILLLVAFLGCERPPHQNVPNAGKVIGKFRQARDTCYEYAAIAKDRVILPKRLQEGQNLYAQAKGSHNEAITRIIVAIDSNKSMSKKTLKTLLGKADADRKKFVNWYKKVPGRRQSHIAEGGPAYEGTAAASGPVEIAVTLADLVVELLKMQEARFAEERKELRKELRKCEWADWDSIGSTAGAESPAQ